MIPFCGLVEGFRDPNAVASLSYDMATKEFETLLKESRSYLQNMNRLVPVLSKARDISRHAPLSSRDRRFLAYRIQHERIQNAIDWIGRTTLCREFDKKVLPYAFAFARERARDETRKHYSSLSDSDALVNARLAQFMARDWLEETGNLTKQSQESSVIVELGYVQKWIESYMSKHASDESNKFFDANVQAWKSASLAPILQWEEKINRNVARDSREIVSMMAPEYSSVPNDAIWSLAIHPGGVEAWLKSLVHIGYVPVQAPISSSGSTSASVLDAAHTLDEKAVPAPLSISHAILSSTLSQLPAFLSHTNQRTLYITRSGARASKEAAALKAAAQASLREEQRLSHVSEEAEDNEGDNDDEPGHANVASVLRDDLYQYSNHWKQMRNQVPSNLASLFNYALATPFLSTSSSAAKKRKKWLQDAAAQDQIQTSTFYAMHVAHLDEPPLAHKTVYLEQTNRKLQPIPRFMMPKPNPPAAGPQPAADATQLSASLHPMFAQQLLGVAQGEPSNDARDHVDDASRKLPPAQMQSGNITSQIIHEMSIELNQRGWSEASATSCCYLTSHDTCDICHIPMEQASEQPIQVCPMCYSTRMTLSYYGKGDDNSPFSKYVRKAHFRTYMQQVQFQEQANIDIDDIMRVANFLASRGFTSANGTVGDVRWALLELKMNKCYNHVTQIYCRVFNKPPPRFTPEQKQILFDMFDAIQDPYFSAPNKGRSNFLSYQFVIYKSCELQGWTKYLPYFKMLKGDQNIITHDIIWRYICEQRNWQFIRTLSIQYQPPYFTLLFKDPLLKDDGSLSYPAKAKTRGRKRQLKPSGHEETKQGV